MKKLLSIFTIVFMLATVSYSQATQVSLNVGNTKTVLQSAALDSAGTLTKTFITGEPKSAILQVDCIKTIATAADTAYRQVDVYTALVDETDAYTKVATITMAKTNYIGSYTNTAYISKYVKLVVKPRAVVKLHDKVRCISTLK